jgi:hypothetical protein
MGRTGERVRGKMRKEARGRTISRKDEGPDMARV